MIRFIWIEVVLLLLQRRWLLMIPTYVFIAYASVTKVWADHLNNQVSVNIWDVLMETFNNGYYFRLAFLFLFIYLVSDIFIRDFHSQYHVMVLSRQASRVKWYLSKVIAVGVISFLYMGIGIFLVLLTAAFHLPIEMNYSEHSQGLNDVVKFYGDMPAAGNPLDYMFKLWGYSALGMWVFSMLPVTFSLYWRKWIVPLTVGAGYLLLSTIIMRGYVRAKFDITYHMLYYLHFPFLEMPTFSFSSSFLYLGSFMLIFCFLGWRVLKTSEL